MKFLVISALLLSSTGLSAGESITADLGEARDDSQVGEALVVEAPLRVEAKPGQMVTIVPIATPLRPLSLKIATVQKQFTCEDENDPYWWIETERIKDSSYLAAAKNSKRGRYRPYDAVVVYPSDPKAMAFEPNALPKDLPVARDLVKAAVSLTGSTQAEWLYVTNCLHKPGPYECPTDYSMQSLYEWRSGQWQLTKAFSLC